MLIIRPDTPGFKYSFLKCLQKKNHILTFFLYAHTYFGNFVSLAHAQINHEKWDLRINCVCKGALGVCGQG